MFGRDLAGKLTPGATPVGNENRVTLDAGEKCSDDNEPLDKTDIRGFICCGYDMVYCLLLAMTFRPVLNYALRD